MRIGLNLLHAMPEIGGGWNYIRDIIRSLLNTNSDNHYIIYVTDKSLPIIHDFVKNATIVKIRLNSNHRISRIIYENTILQIQVLKHKLDCMHWFCNYHSVVNLIPSVVTVYDLQPFKEFNKDHLLKRIILKFLVKNAVKKAKYLLPMSESTKNDLSNILHVNANKMFVIPPILNAAFNMDVITQEKVSAFRSKYNLPAKYWVYVAHYYPHKNHITLLQAYYKLITSSDFNPWPLVLRGDRLSVSEEISDTIQKLNLTDYVMILPRLDESELSLLYAAAGAMVFPSVYEGGGIPILEAMACGCPILSSNLPSIKEYAGDSVSYFNARNTEELTASMKSFQSDDTLRDTLRQKGLVQSSKYSSDLIISRLLHVYDLMQVY
jgi:glycosyltransferase involved in cell wall biosynthesis